MMRILSLCLIVLVVMSIDVFPQTTKKQPRNFKIEIESMENTKLSNQVYSYLSREFKDLRDVEIVDTGEVDYLIRFIVHPTKFGWALSYLITVTYHCETIEDVKYVRDSTVRYKLLTGDTNNLKQSITEIITEFDSTELKRERESRKTEHLGLVSPCFN